MDLTDYRFPEADEETWEARDGRRVVRQVQMALPVEARRRRERILQFISSGRRLLRAQYDLRAYDEAQWRAMINRGKFELAAVYDLFNHASRLDAKTRAATFVLRRRRVRQ